MPFSAHFLRYRGQKSGEPICVPSINDDCRLIGLLFGSIRLNCTLKIGKKIVSASMAENQTLQSSLLQEYKETPPFTSADQLLTLCNRLKDSLRSTLSECHSDFRSVASQVTQHSLTLRQLEFRVNKLNLECRNEVRPF